MVKFLTNKTSVICILISYNFIPNFSNFVPTAVYLRVPTAVYLRGRHTPDF